MKKGEIYEGVIEKVDFPNKGIVITDGQKSYCKERNAWTESPFYDQ